jgi:hypothetical protein
MFFKALGTLILLSSCGGPNDQAAILNITHSPEQPNPGDTFVLSVAYDLKSSVTGGIATYSYKVNGLPFSPTVDQLCSQTECPKEPGIYVETTKSTWPSFSGSIVSKIQWTNQENEPVWCLQMNVSPSSSERLRGSTN